MTELKTKTKTGTDCKTRRTKIVTTIGPASNSLENLRKIIASGSDMLRLNMSHGVPAEKAAMVKDIRAIAKQEGRVVAVLADLQGPKIRIACFQHEEVELAEGADFVLNAALGRNDGDATQVGIDYPELVNDVAPGDTLLLDDGRIRLAVQRVEAPKIFCKVLVGGQLSDHKGINRLGGGLSAKALTPKDLEDLRLSVEADIDYIGISFVRSEADVLEAKQLIAQQGGRARVISKIERVEAIEPETLRKIVLASDAVMVARGDLGVEIGDAAVPAAQRLIINMARHCHRPVIVATQMLETMIHSVLPTRAEVSDVANAILDGADAVMTSAETASGDHPVLVVQTMDRICREVDSDLLNRQNCCHSNGSKKSGECCASLASRGIEGRGYCSYSEPVAAATKSCCDSVNAGDNMADVKSERCACEKECITETLTKCALKLAKHIEAKALVLFSHNGDLATRIAAHNRSVPLLVFTDCERTWSSLALSRNVRSFLIPKKGNCGCQEPAAEASNCCSQMAASTEPSTCCDGKSKGHDCSENCRCFIDYLLEQGVVTEGDRLVMVGKCCCKGECQTKCSESQQSSQSQECCDQLKKKPAYANTLKVIIV